MSYFKLGDRVAVLDGHNTFATIIQVVFEPDGSERYAVQYDDGQTGTPVWSAFDLLPVKTELHDINQPSYYTAHPGGIEYIEITRHMNFNLGNAVKYIWRAGLKAGSLDGQSMACDDLRKAINYIEEEITVRKGEPSYLKGLSGNG